MNLKFKQFSRDHEHSPTVALPLFNMQQFVVQDKFRRMVSEQHSIAPACTGGPVSSEKCCSSSAIPCRKDSRLCGLTRGAE
jgi:hypothetical protein